MWHLCQQHEIAKMVPMGPTCHTKPPHLSPSISFTHMLLHRPDHPIMQKMLMLQHFGVTENLMG